LRSIFDVRQAVMIGHRIAVSH